MTEHSKSIRFACRTNCMQDNIAISLGDYSTSETNHGQECKKTAGGTKRF